VGLCTLPDAVKCVLHGNNSFTVKFSHCIPVTTAFTTLWTPQAMNTIATPYAVLSHTTFSSVSILSGRPRVFRLTNTTTASTITAPTVAWSWATWGTGSVGCNGGTTLNMQTLTTPFLYRITGTTNQFNTVDLIYDGAITLHYGAAGVDEQVVNVVYNKFTRIWGDAQTATTDNSRYLTLNGQAMEYRVISTSGAPASGTTPFPDGFDVWVHHPDGMELEKYRVTFDLDGKDGSFPAGTYKVARGVDWEDGRFFLNDRNQIVSLKDKNGPDRADLLSSPAKGMVVDGVRVLGGTTTSIIFAVNFYDANSPLGDGMVGDDAGATCGKPYSNTRCRVEVEVFPWKRTYDVLAADLDTCVNLWDWTATNPKYKDVEF